MAQAGNTAIPRYYLYGDQVSDVELDFIHAEPIRERSGAHDWTIRAHAHPDHHQILLVDQGGGEIKVVENGKTEALFANPQAPYTRKLLNAIPRSESTGAQMVPDRGENIIDWSAKSA